MAEPVTQANLVQGRLGALAALGKAHAGIEQTIGDIIEGRDTR